MHAMSAPFPIIVLSILGGPGVVVLHSVALHALLRIALVARSLGLKLGNEGSDLAVLHLVTLMAISRERGEGSVRGPWPRRCWDLPCNVAPSHQWTPAIAGPVCTGLVFCWPLACRLQMMDAGSCRGAGVLSHRLCAGSIG